MRQVWSPPPAGSTATVSAAMRRGSQGSGRSRLSAISVTPDPDDDTSARLMSSDGDGDVVEGQQRLTRDGRPSTIAARVGNRRVAADVAVNDDERRREDDAAVQALLRDLGVVDSS